MGYIFGLLITNSILFAVVQAISHNHTAAVVACVVWTVVSILGFLSYWAERSRYM